VTDLFRTSPGLAPYADVKGHLLRLPSGLAVVPFEADGHGWRCVVVDGGGAYPVGGYNVHVTHDELSAATRLPLVPAVPPDPEAPR
jgi:hypothetical protein